MCWPSWWNAHECSVTRWGRRSRTRSRMPVRSSRAIPRPVRSAPTAPAGHDALGDAVVGVGGEPGFLGAAVTRGRRGPGGGRDGVGWGARGALGAGGAGVRALGFALRRGPARGALRGGGGRGRGRQPLLLPRARGGSPQRWFGNTPPLV